jgi:hypothetical protein
VSAVPGERSAEKRAGHFAPILTSFTARVAGASAGALVASPALLARATLETQRLLGHGIVLCVHDAALLAEACCASAGGSAAAPALTAAGPDRALAAAPVSALLEAVTQIRDGLPADARVLLTVAGPGMLYCQLRERGGEDPGVQLEAYAATVSVALANAAYAAGADGIALIERFDAEVPARVSRCHRTLRKLADFHDATLVAFSSSGVAPDDSFDQVFDLTLGEGPIVVARSRGGEQPWATTREDVPGDADVATVHAITKLIPG